MFFDIYYREIVRGFSFFYSLHLKLYEVFFSKVKLLNMVPDPKPIVDNKLILSTIVEFEILKPATLKLKPRY